MKKVISNSIRANGRSTIKDVKINVTDSKSNSTKGVTNSIVAESESEIENVSIDIKKEKRMSFWNGFTIGSFIVSLIASATWYIIQKIIDN